MYIRKPQFAWKFYPAHPQILHENIIQLLVDIESTNIDLFSGINIQNRIAIIPHCDYLSSWIVLAQVYKILQKNKKLDKFIIIWSTHSTQTKWRILSNFDAYQTPLGNIKINKDLQKFIFNQKPDIFQISDEDHLKEYSIEVQLPFLQTIFKIENILPILEWKKGDRKELAKLLIQIYKNDKNFWIIISSNLSCNIPYEKAERLDTETIEYIINWKIKNITKKRTCWPASIKLYILLTKLLKLDRVPIVYINPWSTNYFIGQEKWCLWMIS